MLLIKDIVIHKDLSIAAGETMQAAIAMMVRNEHGVVVILNGREPAGILTERDVVKLLSDGSDLNVPLQAALKKILTVKQERTPIFALNLMIDKNIRRLVIVDDNNEFAGVITQELLIRNLEKELYNTHSKIFHILYNRKPLFSVRPDEPLTSAVKTMAENNVGAVVVVKDEKAEGIITERDMLKFAENASDLSVRVDAVMSRPVVTATVETSVADVLGIMKQNNIRRFVIVDADDKVLGIITNRDILRSMEGSYSEFLKNKLQHAREVLDFLPDIVVEIVDLGPEKIIQWCNKKATLVFGHDLVDRPVTALLPEDDWPDICSIVTREGRLEGRRVGINDRIYEMAASYMKIFREGIIQLTLTDITREVQLSIRDYLTGLYNRRKFEETLGIEIERAGRYGGLLCLVMFDIDHFKSVNDTYGHQAGDAVLKELSLTVSGCIRKVDCMARYGGEEFAIIAPGVDIEGAYTLAEKIRKMIESHEFGPVAAVTVSLGVAQLGPSDSKDSFVKRADEALYSAKESGRNKTGR